MLCLEVWKRFFGMSKFTQRTYVYYSGFCLLVRSAVGLCVLFRRFRMRLEGPPFAHLPRGVGNEGISSALLLWTIPRMSACRLEPARINGVMNVPVTGYQVPGTS